MLCKALLASSAGRVDVGSSGREMMNSIMERWIGSCRRELLDRALIWNQRHPA
jgi:putative transposase